MLYTIDTKLFILVGPHIIFILSFNVLVDTRAALFIIELHKKAEKHEISRVFTMVVKIKQIEVVNSQHKLELKMMGTIVDAQVLSVSELASDDH